jgi:hypothetical protein
MWTGDFWVYLNVHDPYVAWEVYRGNLLSAYVGPTPEDWAPIGLVLASAVRRGQEVRLQHELAMERVRAKEFPSAVSRLRGMYFFENQTDAMRANDDWAETPDYFAANTLAQVGYEASPRVTRHDSMWIDRYMWVQVPFGHGDEDWIRRYWAGEALTSSPLWEILAEGSFWVFGVELRTGAHDALADVQPGALPMLELARVAAELESTLGHCAPFVGRSEGRHSLRYLIDMQDATSAEFLTKLRDFQGPKNTAELNAEILERDGLRVPEFMAKTFDFEPAPDLADLIWSR